MTTPAEHGLHSDDMQKFIDAESIRAAAQEEARMIIDAAESRIRALEAKSSNVDPLRWCSDLEAQVEALRSQFAAMQMAFNDLSAARNPFQQQDPTRYQHDLGPAFKVPVLRPNGS